MGYRVVINTDWTIDVFNGDNIKMPELSGNLTVIHDIINSLNTRTYSDLPPGKRITRPDIYIQELNPTSGTINRINLNLNQFKRLATNITDPYCKPKLTEV